MAKHLIKTKNKITKRRTTINLVSSVFVTEFEQVFTHILFVNPSTLVPVTPTKKPTLGPNNFYVTLESDETVMKGSFTHLSH